MLVYLEGTQDWNHHLSTGRQVFFGRNWQPVNVRSSPMWYVFLGVSAKDVDPIFCRIHGTGIFTYIHLYIVVNFYVWFCCITVNIPCCWIRNGNFLGNFWIDMTWPLRNDLLLLLRAMCHFDDSTVLTWRGKSKQPVLHGWISKHFPVVKIWAHHHGNHPIFHQPFIK